MTEAVAELYAAGPVRSPSTLISYQRTRRGYTVAGVKAGIDDLLDLVPPGE